MKSFGQHFGSLRTFWKISLFVALGFSVGCGGGGGSSTSGAVTVTVSPTTASLALGGVQQFTATVANDTSGRGVTWELTQGSLPCAPGCGTVSPTITTSGAPTTYTAPSVAQTLNQAGVTLTATSVVAPSATASVPIVVAGTITVSVSPATKTIALSGTQTFIGVAINDTTNDGLTWELTQNGTSCSPGCGTIAAGETFACPAGTTAPPGGFCSANGGAALYTAPSSPPTNGTVLLVATDIAAPRESGYSTITIQSSVSISLSKTYANVPVKGTATFTATLANDTNNQGVKWTLSQNGSSCSASACGSVSPTSTPSGTATTYTAPASPATVTLTATSVADSTQTATAVIVVQPVSVSVSPLTEILYATQTAQFTATVKNDVLEKGVTWSLSLSGSSCSASTCGTLSATQTPPGTAVTYTAPNSVSSETSVTITATSVTDTSQSATATISLYPPVGVTLSPTTASIALGGRDQFTATVTNDPTSAGVAWSLTQSGNPCSPTCGTVSPTDTSSGVYTVYLAPTTMPSSSTVTLTATSNALLTQTASATITLTSSSSAVTKLSGNYTFLVQGYDSSGSVVMAGSFTADGSGNVTGGLADVNQASGVTTAVPLTGSYTVSSDNTGSVTLTSPSSGTTLATLQFALSSTGDQATLVGTDGSGMRGWGTMDRQTAAPSTASLKGNYAFSMSGANAQGSRFALAGRFYANGAGGISAGVLDSNDGGSLGTEVPFTGSYSVSSTGRGILTADTPDGAMHWAFYMAGPKQLALVSMDPRFAAPAAGGEAQVQATGKSAGGFSTASLDGTSVISLAGTADGGAGSKVQAGLVTFDGSGGLKYSIDRNDGGTVNQLSGSGTYSVEPDGRATIWFSANSTPVVTYLEAHNQGVVVGTGTGVSSGDLDAQAPGPYSDTSLSGAYVIGTSAAPSNASALQLGVLTSSGTGSLTATADSVAPGPVTGHLPFKAQTLQNEYSVGPTGQGVIAGGSVVYMISVNKGVVVDVAPGNAAGTVSRIEK